MRRLTKSQSTLLDCVRGLSALAVMVGHGLSLLPAPPAIGTRYPIQSYGVIVFFVLSGFLIAYNCMTKADYRFSDYMADRFARIFTAFIPALILVAIADPIFGLVYNSHTLQSFIANMLMLHHTPFGRMIEGLPRWEPYGSGRQFWTVAVEWWLYILFGILFFMKSASWPERVVMTLLVAPAALVVLFFTVFESIGLTWVFAAVFAVGFCAFVQTERTDNLAVSAVLFFTVALVIRFQTLNVTKVFNFYDVNFMILTTGLLLSLLVFAAENAALVAALKFTSKFWLWLSGISYSLYLTHQTLHYAWWKILGVPGWPQLIALCVFCIVFAWLFTWAFDSRHRAVAGFIKSRLRTGHGPIIEPSVQ